MAGTGTETRTRSRNAFGTRSRKSVLGMTTPTIQRERQTKEKHPGDLPDFSVSRVKKCAGYVHRKCMEAIVVQQTDPAMNRRIEGSGSVSLFF